jgi:hypothetical protein
MIHPEIIIKDYVPDDKPRGASWRCPCCFGLVTHTCESISTPEKAKLKKVKPEKKR